MHPLVEARERLESVLGKKSFDRLINCETKIRFDIQTSDKLIDCKNIQWVDVSNTKLLEDHMLKRALENFEKIYRHKVVAEILGMKYEFRSKHKMSVILKNYLEQKGVEYIERTCGKCASCLNN